jgi:hypothetical protein
MYFILYTSDASEQCSSEDINSILEVSRRNNPSNSVTGLLISKKPEFLQYLEGPEKAVTALYEKIKNDSRHSSVKTIKDGEIEARVFPDWEMGFAGEEDLQPLKWKWDVDKLTRFSFADELEDSMDVIKAFIGTQSLRENTPVK